MSATPPKKGDVEQTQPPQSPDEASKSPPMEHPDTQTQGPAYEFEVKEQDRWLPIANGWSSLFFYPLCIRSLDSDLPRFYPHTFPA